jgi:hypothetical protein
MRVFVIPLWFNFTRCAGKEIRAKGAFVGTEGSCKDASAKRQPGLTSREVLRNHSDPAGEFVKFFTKCLHGPILRLF